MPEQVEMWQEPKAVTATEQAALLKQDAVARLAEKRKQEEAAEQQAISEFLGEAMEYDQLTLKAQVLYLMKKRYWFDGRFVSMNFWDALAYVAIARENGLSIHGKDIYPLFKTVDNVPRVDSFGKSSEARAKIAKKEGITFGPPTYTEVEREWPKTAATRKPYWTDKDFGVTCDMGMHVADSWKPASYTAWLSEWYQGKPDDKERKSYWDRNPMWMLQIRSKDKLITLSSGVGQSDPQEDAAVTGRGDSGAGDSRSEILPPEKPEINTTEFKERKKNA